MSIYFVTGRVRGVMATGEGHSHVFTVTSYRDSAEASKLEAKVKVVSDAGALMVEQFSKLHPTVHFHHTVNVTRRPERFKEEL